MEQENTPEIAQVGSFRAMFYSYSLSGADGNFSLDPELLKLTGFQASFFKTPHSLSQIFHPEDRPSLEEALSKAMKGEKSAFEVRIRLSQGTYLKAENILIPILENENIKRIEGALVPISEEKQGEKRERSLEMDFQSLFQHVPVGVFQTTFDGKLIRANPALVKMLGYSSEEELISVPVENHYVNPGYRAKWLKEIGNLKEIRNAELKLKRRDGKIITVFEDSYIVRSPQGDPLFIEGILVDITELKKIQEALWRSEEEKRLILDSVEESVSLHDRDHRIIWANRAALQSLNLPLEKVVGRVCYELWYGSSQPCEGCPVTTALETGEYKYAEARSPDGRVWLTRAVPVRNEKGEVIGVVDSSLDITRLKRAEEALKESQTFLEAIISNSPMAISVRKATGDLLFVNEAWKKFWRLTDAQIRELEEKSKGLKLTERISYLKEFAPKIEQMLQEGGKLWIPEVQVTGTGLRDGSWISIHFYTLKDNEGKVDRLVAMTQDITLQKMADEEIRKAKEDFLYSVSHELKTPVLALLSALEIIRSFPLEERPQRFLEYEAIWKRNLDRLMALIENLLDSQKSRTRGLSLNCKPTDLEALLKELVLDFKPNAHAKGVKIHLKVKNELTQIELDPEAIRKSISNLLSNAIKFSPHGGVVEISLQRKEKYAEISVKDRGPGISPEEQQALFNPFRRARSAEEKAVPGTGLGLYVTKLLVEKHGGEVLLRSAPDKGTTVIMRLPLKRARSIIF
ncbi:MAG: PAS domain S-box protein [bacterium]